MAPGVLRGSLYNAYLDDETLFLRVFEDCANQILLNQPERSPSRASTMLSATSSTSPSRPWPRASPHSDA